MNLTRKQQATLDGPPTGKQHSEDFWILTLWPQQLIAKPQMRRTFDWQKIMRLARSLATTGQVNEVLVNFCQSELVVFAGGRRWRAARLASTRLRCKVFKNLEPLKLVGIQQDENLNDPVLAEEEAISVADHFFSKRELVPDLTVAQYCRETGKSRYQVITAVSFATNLDPFVVDMVLKGMIGFTVAAAEIARIKSSKRQQDLALDAYLFNLTGKEVRQRVHDVLWNEEGGQASMVENWGGETWIHEQRRVYLEREVHDRTRDAIGFFQRLQILMEDRLLPRSYMTPAVLEKIQMLKEAVSRFDEMTETMGTEVLSEPAQ